MISRDESQKLWDLIDNKASVALKMPGVLALEAGYRTRQGRVTDEPAVVVTVASKVEPENLSDAEDLRAIFGPDNVDVVEAGPLKTIFAQPGRFGVDAATLALLEARFGSPFESQALGPRPFHLAGARPLLAAAAAVAPEIFYEGPPNAELREIEGPITLRCHAGPDAGWAELRRFLEGADVELVAGMYELTAPHVGDFLEAHLGGQSVAFRLTLDKGQIIGEGTKRNDRTEAVHIGMFRNALGDDFNVAYASTAGPRQTFQTDYHIKLAVRDRASFWLSSGSWQSSNQPSLDPLGADANDERIHLYNREWHVIGTHAALSETFARFLEWDFSTAEREGPAVEAAFVRPELPDLFVPLNDSPQRYRRFFPPADFTIDAGPGARVMPLLTPDNYIEALTELVDGAVDELLVQNQSLGFLKDEEDQDQRYTDFVALLARKSQELRDFKLILRNYARENLELYGRKGFNLDRVRFQVGCHNKGIIADGRKTLIGSHNFTNAGTTANRDASLFIEDTRVAAYYRDIFLHDWEMVSAEPEPLNVRVARPGELPPPGMRRVAFNEVFDVS